jgi:hypothetical protein
VAWQKLFHAALSETDRRALPRRIAEAERAIMQRTSELIDSNVDSIEEDEALDDALYALHALQNSLAQDEQAA